eukprot:8519527-Pyramimonas_sp.AAC.1
MARGTPPEAVLTPASSSVTSGSTRGCSAMSRPKAEAARTLTCKGVLPSGVTTSFVTITA